MSYILDAVKRAQAERERGAVPGLNARQITASIYPQSSLPGARLRIVAALVLAVGLALAAWWLLRTPAGNAVVTASARPAASAEPAPAPLASQPPAPSATTAPQAVPAASPAPAPDLVLAPAVSASARVPEKTAPVQTTVALPNASAPIRAITGPTDRGVATVQASVGGKDAGSKPAARALAVGVPEASSPPKLAAPDNAARNTPAPSGNGGVTTGAGVPMMTELPESLRRQIPPLSINGAIFSDSPKQWALLVNDQVLSPGSMAAPDLKLEEISASSSVFSFRGTRFRVDY